MATCFGCKTAIIRTKQNIYKVKYNFALYGIRRIPYSVQLYCTYIQGTVLIQKVLYLYVLLWPDDGCFRAKTCSPDVTDVSSLY